MAGKLDCRYVGMDGLDVAFMGALTTATIAALQEAKACAQQDGEPALIELGGVPVKVYGHGAKGFSFTVDTGEDGEVWFFTRSDNLEGWNGRVSVRSLPLSIYGYFGVKRRLFERAAALGFRIIKESISRVDVAADFVLPDFEPRLDCFVARGRCRQQVYADAEVRPAVNSEILVNYAARSVTSVTIGTMPGRQIILYDKRRQAVKEKLWHWFEKWGVDRADKSLKVWRIEVRAGKDYLSDFGLKTFADLEAMVGDVLRTALEQVRYTKRPRRDTNVSRRRNAPLWDAVRAAFLELLAAPEEHAGQHKVTVGRRAEKRRQYVGLAAGLVASFAEVADLPPDAPPGQIVDEMVNAICRAVLADKDRFERSRRRARNRLVFVRDEYAAQ